MSTTVKIEQRLQDPQRVLLLPIDEALALILPFIFGVIGNQVPLGALLGVVAWWVWGKVKGEGGLELLVAATYWYLPASVKAYKEFPDSAQDHWEA